MLSDESTLAHAHTLSFVGTRWLAVFVALPAVAIAAGCSADHTVGHVRLLNDTNRTVVIWRCKDEACHSLTNRSVVKPRGGGPVPTSIVGVPNPFVVMSEEGKRLGCLPLVLPHYVEGLVARVSRAVPCRDSYSDTVQCPPS
jgi:hypothetical protein